MSTPLQAPELSGEVRFRREGDDLCIHYATSVMWFARHALDRNREPPDVGLSFDGTHVTLRVQWPMDLEADRPHPVL